MTDVTTVETTEDFDDEPFDPEAVRNGAWARGPYGPDDEIGTFNEVTPEKTASALAMLDLSRPVKTYNLSETLSAEFPVGLGRSYQQVLQVLGYAPPDDFEGILAEREPLGPWEVSSQEERVSLTFNMGTKINGLHHVGIGGVFYNGFKGAEFARTWGTTVMGCETQGPIVTRGVLLDIVGYKVATGATDDYEVLSNGAPMLRSHYRITVEDMKGALEWEGVRDDIGPGDVVLIRTGWRQLIEVDRERWLSMDRAGPYLRECRWLAARRVAIIGVDHWYFGHGTDYRGMLCHQELPVKYGIRVGETVPSDVLADDEVYEFVFAWNALHAKGAISSNAPPIALGQPRG